MKKNLAILAISFIFAMCFTGTAHAQTPTSTPTITPTATGVPQSTPEPVTVTDTLPINDYRGYFPDPISLPDTKLLDVDFYSIFDPDQSYTGIVASTLVAMATPTVLRFYLAARIGVMGIMFIWNFVLKNIGRGDRPPPSVTTVRYERKKL